MINKKIDAGTIIAIMLFTGANISAFDTVVSHVSSDQRSVHSDSVVDLNNARPVPIIDNFSSILSNEDNMVFESPSPTTRIAGGGTSGWCLVSLTLRAQLAECHIKPKEPR